MTNPSLRIWNDSQTFDETITYEYIIRGLKTNERLTNNLDSTSSTVEVQITPDYPYTLAIIEQNDDLHAQLTDGQTVIFTGYVSPEIKWTVDSHGEKVCKFTLEDTGTKLLSAPYSATTDVVIQGTFSQCLTSICTVAGISQATNIPTDNTPVARVAKAGETCLDLLSSLCKELGFVFFFEPDGKMNLRNLVITDTSSAPTVYDNGLYDSINLTRKARQYKGSRIQYDLLTTVSYPVGEEVRRPYVYRDISNQDTSFPDCKIELSNDEYYPANTVTSIKAVDLAAGRPIWAISDIYPEVHWDRGSGTSEISIIGADTVGVRLHCTSTGGYQKARVTQLQARANMIVVSGTEVVYGDQDISTQDVYSMECQWIHDKTPAEKLANLSAQWWRYCNREFQFKSKNNYALGTVLHLNENLHSGLSAYILISSCSQNGVSNVKTYTAYSVSSFDLSKTTSSEATYIPPSDSYINMPSVIESTSLTICPLKSTLIKDLRSSATQTLGVQVFTTGGTISGITLSASLSDGTVLTVTPVTTDFEWEVTVPKNTTTTEVNLVAIAGTIEERASVSFIDKTEYYLFHGALSSAPSSPTVVLNGDYYINTTDGITYQYDDNQNPPWVPLQASDAESAGKLLNALNAAVQSGVPLETLNNPNTTSWFNLIISARAVINYLFTQYITLLNGGSIHSDSYSDVGVKVNTNPGFWLGSNGQLLCDSGQMTNLTISGNSVFSGNFSCASISTAFVTPTPISGANASTQISGINWEMNQASKLRTALGAYGTTMVPCRINGYNNYWETGTKTDLAYYTTSSGTEGNRPDYLCYRVAFYDFNGDLFDLRTLGFMTTQGSSSDLLTDDPKKIVARWGQSTGHSNACSYTTISVTIQLMEGSGDTLILNIPNNTTGLSRGMVYYTQDNGGTTGTLKIKL